MQQLSHLIILQRHDYRNLVSTEIYQPGVPTTLDLVSVSRYRTVPRKCSIVWMLFKALVFIMLGWLVTLHCHYTNIIISMYWFGKFKVADRGFKVFDLVTYFSVFNAHTHN